MRRRGVSVGRGARPFFGRGKCPLGDRALLRGVFRAHGALSAPRKKTRRVRRHAAGALREERKGNARCALRPLVRAVRGDARRAQRPLSESCAPAVFGGASFRRALYAQGDEGAYPAQHPPGAPSSLLRLCLRAGRGAPLRRGKRSVRRDGDLICGHERPVGGARPHGSGKGSKASRALRALGGAPHRPVGGVRARLYLPRRGGRYGGGTSLSLCDAREAGLFFCLRARHFNFARLLPLSSSRALRKDRKREKKERRKRRFAAFGVRSVGDRARRHRARLLSAFGGRGRCLFNSLCFLRVSFREGPQGSTSPRQAGTTARSRSSQGRA